MFDRTELYAPDGNLLWDSSESTRPPALDDDPQAGVVADLLGVAGSCDQVTTAAIRAECERLNLFTRAGCAPGFITVLPRGWYADDVVESINAQHAHRLNAARIDFPLIFDRARSDMRSLTDGYESQHRMYDVSGGSRRELRLAYAADPGLFSWLRGRTLAEDRLPYTIYSPAQVLRKRQSGETDVFTLNQYTLPDLHALCAPADAQGMYTLLVKEAADTSRSLFGDAAAQFLEIAPDAAIHEPKLPREIARAANLYTVVRYLDEQKRYFQVKGGINIHCGPHSVMLYNFQWDNSNTERFNFRTSSGQPVTVIHSTLAGGWPKVLPIVVGRALSGWTPRELPPFLTPDPLVLVPVLARHTDRAADYAHGLRSAGIPAAVSDTDTAKGLGARIHHHRRSWTPFHAVIGDKEDSLERLTVTRSGTGEELSVSQLASRYGHQFTYRNTTPPAPRFDLPFS